MSFKKRVIEGFKRNTGEIEAENQIIDPLKGHFTYIKVEFQYIKKSSNSKEI